MVRPTAAGARLGGPPRIALPASAPVNVPFGHAAILELQRTAGNAATASLLRGSRRAGPPGDADGTAAVARAAALVVQRAGPQVLARPETEFQKDLVQAGWFSVAFAGKLAYPDPKEEPESPLSAAELQLTIKANSHEFSTAVLKASSEIDLGPHVQVGLSCALFKLSAEQTEEKLKELEFSAKAAEVELTLSGKFGDSTMKTSWGRALFGGTAFGRALASGKVEIQGAFKFSIAMPAEDAARLAQIAAHHRQLKAMAAQNKAWTKQLKANRARIKELQRARGTVGAAKRSAINKEILKRLDAENKLRKLLKTNQVKGKELLSLSRKLAKSIGPFFQKILGKAIPVVNVLLLMSDVVKLMELLYGLISGKGYTLSMSGAEGGTGEGEGLDGGSAAEVEGVEVEGAEGEAAPPPAAESAASDVEDPDALLEGLEGQVAGGGEAFRPPELNPNAARVLELLKSKVKAAINPSSIALLNRAVSQSMPMAQVERLVETLKGMKLSAKPFDALTHVLAAAGQIAKSGAGRKGAGGAGMAEGAGGDDIILLEDDVRYDPARATSAPTESAEVEPGAQPANAPVPSEKGGSVAPAPIDPDMRAFMKRAMAAMAERGLPGYAEFDGAITYNSIAIGQVFQAKITVTIPTEIPDGEVGRRTEDVVYGGEAMLKVMAKLASGDLDVVRSVMPLYNRYGRYVGKGAAARITVGYEGHKELVPAGP